MAVPIFIGLIKPAELRFIKANIMLLGETNLLAFWFVNLQRRVLTCRWEDFAKENLINWGERRWIILKQHLALSPRPLFWHIAPLLRECIHFTLWVVPH
jgi:hypothetical protein